MRKRKNPELRVFKLRSGEEIIAKISGKSRDKIKILRPMRIINSVTSDPFTGAKKHVVYFSDWLGCTTELEADIPSDFIVVDLPPDPDMVSLYSRQLEALDKDTGQQTPRVPKDEAPPPITDEELKSLISSIDQQMEDLYKKYDEEMGKGKKKGNSKTPPHGSPFGVMPPMGSPLPPGQSPGLLFTFCIPGEVMNQWIENGVLDYLKDCMEDFMDIDLDDLFDDEPPKKPKKSKKPKTPKEKWKEPTDEDKKKPGFGNNLTDWSPFVKDYFEGGENPPKKE